MDAQNHSSLVSYLEGGMGMDGELGEGAQAAAQAWT